MPYNQDWLWCAALRNSPVLQCSYQQRHLARRQTSFVQDVLQLSPPIHSVLVPCHVSHWKALQKPILGFSALAVISPLDARGTLPGSGHSLERALVGVP